MMKSTAKSRGMMGIGTLIIFIAVILVAAVAAAVLVSTAGNLQQTGLATGSQAEEGVATGVEVIAVMATDATSDHTIEDFEVIMRLQAGGNPLNLNNTAILIDTTSSSQNLDYSGSTTDTGSAAGTSDYKVYYVKSGPDYENNYMSRGDVVKVLFTSTNGVTENQKVRIKIIPRVGQAAIVDFTTPDVMTAQRITLWP